MPEIHKNKTLAALRNDSRDLKIANRRIKELEDNCEEERKRGDRYQRDASEFKKGLKEIDSIILQQSETLRPLRPDFFRTVRQIHRSLEDGPRGPKLVTTLLQEFDCDLNASVYLDGLQVDLDTWAKEYWPGERGAVYNEISAKIKNHRLGKSNEVQKLREQIAGLENSLENKCEETRQRQEIENDLRLKMQQLKEGHYQTTAQLRQEHEGLKTRHTEEVTKIKRDHENKLARLNGEIPTREKIHKDKIERLWNEHNRAIARLEAKHTEAETSAQGIYVQETTRLNKTINQLTQELNQQKGLLQKKVSELQESHDSKIQLQGRNHKTKEEGLLRQLSEAKRNHEREVEELKLKHESSLQAERNTHSATIEKMKQGHEEEKSIWQTDLAKEKEKHASEKLRLNAEYNQRREKIKEEHKSQLGKLTAKLDKIEDKHAAELHKLRGSFEHEIEAYCAALLARDKFTPLPDSDISVMFMALKQDVDALSLLEWKADRKKWPNKVLRQLSDNQRSLKQQMLQNIIWRSLYEYIFCSPFRVLGEEGRLLEKQWNDEYSQDPQFDNGFYIWPQPGMEAERWRYVTVKECRAALRMRLPSEWDSRAKLKKSFKSSLEKLRETVGTRIAEVAEYNKGSVQAMEQMTIKAVNMWLEFGEQRCRVLAIEKRPNSAVVDEKVNKAVSLLVLPQLKRYGKSDGQDLDIEEVIKGCEGESISLSEV